MSYTPDSSAPMEPPLTPLQRLEASRDSLRRYLIKSDRAEDKDDSRASGIVGSFNGWINGLRTNPLTAAVVEAVQAWWYHHPLHTVSKLGAGAAREFAEPYIRKYPLTCMGGALVVGVAAARIKPWRWVIRPALFAGLSSHIVTRLLSDAPLEFVLDVLHKFKPRAESAAPIDPVGRTEPVAPVNPLDPADPYVMREPTPARATVPHPTAAETATAP